MNFKMINNYHEIGNWNTARAFAYNFNEKKQQRTIGIYNFYFGWLVGLNVEMWGCKYLNGVHTFTNTFKFYFNISKKIHIDKNVLYVRLFALNIFSIIY